MRTLNLYIDEHVLLRVGGCLVNVSILKNYAKRPLKFPKYDRFSCLLVELHLTKNCHKNIGSVVGDIRQKYWIPSLRSLVRSIKHKCYVCKRRKAKAILPQMAILSVDRVTPLLSLFRIMALIFSEY